MTPGDKGKHVPAKLDKIYSNRANEQRTNKRSQPQKQQQQKQQNYNILLHKQQTQVNNVKDVYVVYNAVFNKYPPCQCQKDNNTV